MVSGKLVTNYSPSSATDITAVPVQTAFFTSWPSGWTGALTSQWILFFQSLAKQGAGSGNEIYRARLLLNNTAAGNDIAPWITVDEASRAFQVNGVLRRTIAANLVVRINKNQAPFIVCTFNSTVQPGTMLTWTAFASNTALAAGDVFSFDVLASDGSSDPNGVASLSILSQ
jgi:hypothetical protein